MHYYHDSPTDWVRTRERAHMGAAGTSREGTFTIETSATRAHAEASRRRRLESGRAILRDALSYEHPRESMTMERDQSHTMETMRPPNLSLSSSNSVSRRTRGRPAVEAISPGDPVTRPHPATISSLAAAYIPSPPHSSSDHSSRSSPDILQSTHSAASLTPRFAPAYLAQVSSLTADTGHLPHYPSHQNSLAVNRAVMREQNPQRRANAHRAPTATHNEASAHDALDGLGDRWRSISPDNDSWETLLSTMPPDEHLPSTSASSFRSNEDTVPYENHQNVAEANTGSMNPYPVICENTDSDFTESEEDGMANHLRLRGERYSHAIEYRAGVVPPVGASHERARDLPPSHSRQRNPADVSVRSNQAERHWLQQQALDDRTPFHETRQSDRPSRERL
ncbi:MAG: hypothetical protein Q9220_004183 [cf. Caloplaca sp. 1 TL-2023]